MRTTSPNYEAYQALHARFRDLNAERRGTRNPRSLARIARETEAVMVRMDAAQSKLTAEEHGWCDEASDNRCVRGW